MLGIWVFWGLELYLEYSRIQFCTLVPTKNSSEYAPWIIKVDKTIGLCSRLNHRNRHFFVVWDLSCCWTNKNLDPHEIKLLLKKGHYNLLMPAVCNKFQVTPEILFQQWSSAQIWPCVIFLSVKLSMIKLIISQRTKDVKSDQHDQPYPYHPWSRYFSLHLPSKNNNHSWIRKYTNRPHGWIRRHRPKRPFPTKPSTAHKASVSAGMARLKAAALDKSARYFPLRSESAGDFFVFSPKTNEEFVRTPDFLWKIHATWKIWIQSHFSNKMLPGLLETCCYFQGLSCLGGLGLWVAYSASPFTSPQFKSEPAISHPKCWSFLVGKPKGLLGTTILGNPQKVALLLRKQTVFLNELIQVRYLICLFVQKHSATTSLYLEHNGTTDLHSKVTTYRVLPCCPFPGFLGGECYWVLGERNIMYIQIYIYIYEYGGFLKRWVSPTTMGFPTRNDQHLGCEMGGKTHHLRKHPYVNNLYWPKWITLESRTPTKENFPETNSSHLSSTGLGSNEFPFRKLGLLVGAMSISFREN